MKLYCVLFITLLHFGYARKAQRAQEVPNYRLNNAKLQSLVDKMWRGDHANRVNVRPDFQGHVNDRTSNGQPYDAPHPLFGSVTLDEVREIRAKPIYQKYEALMDNYIHQTGRRRRGRGRPEVEDEEEEEDDEEEEEEEDEEEEEEGGGMPRPGGGKQRRGGRKPRSPRGGMPQPDDGPSGGSSIGLDHLKDDAPPLDKGAEIGFDALEAGLRDKPYPEEVYKVQSPGRKSAPRRSAKPPRGSRKSKSKSKPRPKPDEEEEEEEEEAEEEKEPRRSAKPRRSGRKSKPKADEEEKEGDEEGEEVPEEKESKPKPKSKPRRSKGSKGSKASGKNSAKPKGSGGSGKVAMPVREGTIQDARDFDAERDANSIRKAMKGIGCDAKAITEILCTRSNKQRQELRSKYHQMFGRHLRKDLVSELHGHHEDVCVSLTYTPSEFDAVEIRRAVKGAGTKEDILIEILASRSNAQIADMKKDYHRMFKRNLEKDIESDTSYNFKKLMVALCQGARDESGRVSESKAAKDAAELYKAGEKKWGTEESRFNAIIAAQSFPQLQLVFKEYSKLSKNDLEKAIHKEFSGDIMNGLLAVVKCARHTPTFFAERLYLSMKGAGTKDKNLVRLVVSRSEVDMVQVKEAYLARFGKTLEHWIKGDTSGKYRDALLLLVQGNK